MSGSITMTGVSGNANDAAWSTKTARRHGTGSTPSPIR